MGYLWKAIWDIRKSFLFPIVTVLYNENAIFRPFFILISHVLSVFPVETKFFTFEGDRTEMIGKLDFSFQYTFTV